MESPKIKSLKVIQQVEVKTLFDLAKAEKISAGGVSTEVMIDVERAWDKMVNHTGFTPRTGSIALSRSRTCRASGLCMSATLRRSSFQSR